MSSTKTTKRLNLDQLHAAGIETFSVIGDPDSDDEKVIETEDVTQVELDSVIDSYVYDPDFGKPVEVLNLRNAYPTLRAWAEDAATQYAAWPNKTQNQKNDVTRVMLQRLGLMCDRLADLIQHLGLD